MTRIDETCQQNHQRARLVLECTLQTLNNLDKEMGGVFVAGGTVLTVTLLTPSASQLRHAEISALHEFTLRLWMLKRTLPTPMRFQPNNKETNPPHGCLTDSPKR